MPAARGCGSRQKGGVYAELGLSPNGSPLEDFMICPPVPVDPQALGLSARGVKLFQDERGIWHVLDWVGTNHYPNPTDDLEEIRRMGMSARLELSSPDEYAKLTHESRILRVHAHAYIKNQDALREYWMNHPNDFKRLGYEWDICPKHLAGHISFDPMQPPMCLGLLYTDLILARPVDDDPNPRAVLREMPSFEYKGYRAPDAVEPEYQPAIYASFPIQRLVVVRDDAGGTHEQKTQKVRRSSLFDPETGIVEE